MLPSPRYRWEGLKSKSKLVFNNSSPEGKRVDLVDCDIRTDQTGDLELALEVGGPVVWAGVLQVMPQLVKDL